MIPRLRGGTLAKQRTRLRHILSVEDFDRDLLEELFTMADSFVAQIGLRTPSEVLDSHAALLKNHHFFNIYYEPSTRTRISFETAGNRLGMNVVTESHMGSFSSAAKGETLADTILVLCEYYPHVISIRHDKNAELHDVVHLSTVPIINAGDGSNEHPTQALIDTYSIYRELGRLDNLMVVIGGDLKYGRTARSLALTLSMFEGIKILFVSLPELRIEDDLREKLQNNGVWFKEIEIKDLNKVGLEQTDVVYWTRPQLERMKKDDIEIPMNRLREYTITSEMMRQLPGHARLFHPLPKTFEIAPEVDFDPRSVYHRQAGYGVPVRMSILTYLVPPRIPFSPEEKVIPDSRWPWQRN